MSDDPRRSAVVAAFPSLADDPLIPLGEGQFAEAFLVRDVVVRFPRSEFGRKKLKNDVELLRIVAGDLPLPTSVSTYDALDRPLATAFTAHTYLRGSVLRASDVADLDPSTRDRLARAIGSFLKALHDVDVGRVPPSIPRVSPRTYVSNLRQRVGAELFPRMGSKSRDRARRELDRLDVLSDDREALCHTDIGGNIIFDASSGGLGVIDFGEATVAHPVLDVASLSVLGDAFVRAASESYPFIAEAQDAAAAVRGTFALQDALGGASQDDWPYVDQVLAGYERDA